MSEGLRTHGDGRLRCWWCGDDSLYVEYHDREWGRPVHDDTRLFEKICLEGFQSGLSWLTILRKRENFRRAFAGFDIQRVARFSDDDVARLVDDVGIIRHRGKIVSTINNARRCEELVSEVGSLDAFVWRYEREPSDDVPRSMSDVPAQSVASVQL
ncbi:MAG: DNA-3-methyladenine glycosylase I, partial [Ilumatobacteraceae bacterium]